MVGAAPPPFANMPLLKLLMPPEGGFAKTLGFATIAGISNGALLGIVNSAIQSNNATHPSIGQFLPFMIAFGLYSYCSRRTFDRTTDLFEQSVIRMRIRITDKIAGINLRGLDELDRAELGSRLTQDTSLISESSGVIGASLQSAVMVVFITLYMAMLSLPAFIMGIVVVGGGIAVYAVRARAVSETMQAARNQEVAYVERLEELLRGFKEVRLNDRRSRELLHDLHTTVQDAGALNIKAQKMFNANYNFAYSLFYLLMGFVAFILAQFVPTKAVTISELVATILFLIGPLSTVVSAIPALAKSNVGAQRLMQIDELLDRHDVRANESDRPVAGNFEKITFDGITFRFDAGSSRDPFAVGPIDVELLRGETLFVVGGNGSGKSTMLKMMSGLYPLDGGSIRIDAEPVNSVTMRAYRNLFTAIFSDFHLFRKLYGVDAAPDEVYRLLQTMDVSGKTALAGGAFTELDLSTGQRKRLAMVVALLEDRPILIFDEWAADQDPEFRQFFYRTLLPDLKAAGKTIICVSHDDRYFNVADRVVHMEFGAIDRIDARPNDGP